MRSRAKFQVGERVVLDTGRRGVVFGHCKDKKGRYNIQTDGGPHLIVHWSLVKDESLLVAIAKAAAGL